MQTPAILLVLLLCAALALYLSLRSKAWLRDSAPWPFYAKRPKPRPEQALYQRLVSALPGHIVLARVALVDVLGVKRGFEPATWSRRMRDLQYDFVVCAKNGSVLAAITLDDTAHDTHVHSRAESIKERASAAAGLRLLRWQTKALPGSAEIRALFGSVQPPFFDDTAFSANASWWPPMARERRGPPAP
jgi:Protein of unknown function (DUF2726)